MRRPPLPAPSQPWLWHLCLFGPVTLCTAICLFLALRALPLAGGPRVVFAVAVTINVWLLALVSWSSLLAAASGLLRRKPA